jgi:hypothetical protein
MQDGENAGVQANRAPNPGGNALSLNSRPTISVTPLKSGRGFSARIIWPNGEAQNIGYFRHRGEALTWIVNESDAWVRNHLAASANPVYEKSTVDAPRAWQLERAMASGRIVYHTLPPRHAALHRGLPVPSVERLNVDCQQIDIVQAPHIDVDLIGV